MPRATTYSSTMAESVANHLAAGRTLSAFATENGVTRMSLYNWRAKHPEFDAACRTIPTASTVPVTLRPPGAIIFSLAAWNLPADLAHPPSATMTEDEVDERLWERQNARAA